MVNKFGCRVIPNSELTPPKSLAKLNMSGYRRFLHRTGLEVLWVPIRMRGLTSSGTPRRCYFNVENLVEVFGGNVVVGWSVSIDTHATSGRKDRIEVCIKLRGHAVWLNKEGQLSDPTAKSWFSPTEVAQRESSTFGVNEENGKFYYPFIPLRVGTIDDCYGCSEVMLDCVVDRHGKKVRDWRITAVCEQFGELVPVSWDKLDRRVIDMLILYKQDWEGEFESWDAYCDARRQVGKFTDVSLRSGKTLDEIRVIKAAKFAA